MLRRHLARLVHGYMLPAHWMPFERLPKNANGKIDRRRLKELFGERVDSHAAQST
jgi:acyl-coenzyme A synthetase/AMP-(fatty) acid ligase